ncbi:MAG: serine hydrolase domain-containing protein [Actinomycetota bacterium]
MTTRHPHHDRRSIRTGARALALAGALAVIGTACGSDDPETAEANPATPAEATTTTTTPTTDATTEAPAAEPSATGEITVAVVIDFETGDGVWDVTDGADVLGCDGGSSVEGGFAAGTERTLSCDDGERSGTIVIRFAPEPVAPDSDEFASDWTVHAATGDFVGLRGGGDWSATINAEGSGADELIAGSVEFGDPTEDLAEEAARAEAGTPEGVLDQAFLDDVLDRLDVPEDAEGTVSVAVIDADGEVLSATDGNALDGEHPGTADPVRVGSISKVFTSLATLSLVADGEVALDDRASAHVSRVPVPDGVTVRDLLQHTSGIPEHIVTEGFFDSLAHDRLRRWTPEEIIGLVDGVDADFEPGAEFGYSNSNYIVLGILLEEVTGRPAHEVIRERVIDVVGMPSTYLAGAEDGPEPVGAFADLLGQPLEPTSGFDYTSIATAAWTAGAVVSTGDDLHGLFTALVAGDIIPAELVGEMTTAEMYGLGIELWDADASLIGHGGSIPGYETLAFHDPASGRTAFWSSTSNELFWGPIVEDVVNQMVPGLGDDG